MSKIDEILELHNYVLFKQLRYGRSSDMNIHFNVSPEVCKILLRALNQYFGGSNQVLKICKDCNRVSTKGETCIAGGVH